MLRALSLLLPVMFVGYLAVPAGGQASEPLEPLDTIDAGRGWEAVGRLNFRERGFCTASLITADVVMTAAHCLFDKATGARLAPDEIEFQAGLRSGRAEAHRGVRRIVMHPGYDFAAEDRLRKVGSDLALLELDRPIREGHVRPFRTQSRIGAGQSVEVVSYARDRADAPSREKACTVLTRDADVLVLSCSVDFGASGAPVFASFNGETRIVSVISAKAEWEGHPVALAAAMEGELDALVAEFARTPALEPSRETIQVEGTVSTASQ
jgi:V8-like Glu-specific endopeptidase